MSLSQVVVHNSKNHCGNQGSNGVHMIYLIIDKISLKAITPMCNLLESKIKTQSPKLSALSYSERSAPLVYLLDGLHKNQLVNPASYVALICPLTSGIS